jgi:hypothetical protein
VSVVFLCSQGSETPSCSHHACSQGTSLPLVVKSASDALALGTALVEAHLVEHVVRDHDCLENKALFFVFPYRFHHCSYFGRKQVVDVYKAAAASGGVPTSTQKFGRSVQHTEFWLSLRAGCGVVVLRPSSVGCLDGYIVTPLSVVMLTTALLIRRRSHGTDYANTPHCSPLA